MFESMMRIAREGTIAVVVGVAFLTSAVASADPGLPRGPHGRIDPSNVPPGPTSTTPSSGTSTPSGRIDPSNVPPGPTSDSSDPNAHAPGSRMTNPYSGPTNTPAPSLEERIVGGIAGAAMWAVGAPYPQDMSGGEKALRIGAGVGLAVAGGVLAVAALTVTAPAWLTGAAVVAGGGLVVAGLHFGIGALLGGSKKNKPAPKPQAPGRIPDANPATPIGRGSPSVDPGAGTPRNGGPGSVTRPSGNPGGLVPGQPVALPVMLGHGPHATNGGSGGTNVSRNATTNPARLPGVRPGSAPVGTGIGIRR